MGKSSKRKIMIGISVVGSLFLATRVFIKKKEIDREIPKEESKRGSNVKAGYYEAVWKPGMDKILSFTGLILISPVFLLLSLAIYIDDPGPVFFSQKRVGKDKQFFSLHKFRTMKMETPHDVPTHQLEHPEQYITRIGKLLRRTSLDELPQLWDIFRGKMSIVGPRPALWNQDDLIAERDRYDANGIKPGLTGWAQINGRDELEIPDKARLDGEYVRHLRQGGLWALFFDAKCIAGTVVNVLDGDGVVEGGTGSMDKSNSIDPVDAGFEEYAYKREFVINTSTDNHKRVLITGKGSYIGDSFAAYVEEHYPNLAIDTIDLIDNSWTEYDFAPYDTVFHVAGIAHRAIGKESEEEKARYYAVNTDLALEVCRKAKSAGVGQFIFMSSMSIYGDSLPFCREKVIDEYTIPTPSNLYGDSKWQADIGVRKFQSPDFHVAVLRPPMIYGKGCKGNYPVLAKLAKKMPVFPDVENSRSMLYIDNFCEFLSLLIMCGKGGIFFPQNQEYTKTSDMVKCISEMAGKKIWVTQFLRPAVAIGSYVPGKVSRLVNKAFGSFVYKQNISIYPGIEYRTVGLSESIKRTEGMLCCKK